MFTNGAGSAATDEEPDTAANFHDALSVGDNVVPADLRLKNNLKFAPRRSSGRDGDNNIIVYWSTDADERPSDGAACWMYVNRPGGWSQSY